MTEEGSPTEPVSVVIRQANLGLRAAGDAAAALVRGSAAFEPRRAPRRACLVLVLVACLATVRLAHGQDDVQLWISANTSGAVRGPYRVSAELHGRWRDDVRHYERTVVRLQGGRALTKHLTAWFGFEENWSVAGRTYEEARIWQQVIFVQPAGMWALSHRARIEERFVDGADRMVPRFRYSLRATRPFHSNSRWGAVLGTEIFLQLRDVYREQQLYPAGLDRDRAQVGISRRLTRAFAVEPSYILQFIKAPAPQSNRREHLIQVQVVHRF
jgi:hypothetical protein